MVCVQRTDHVSLLPAPRGVFQVIFGEDARKKLADGINAVSDAVKVRKRLICLFVC